jgi:endonuclease YncB( thermonuclease family)
MKFYRQIKKIYEPYNSPILAEVIKVFDGDTFTIKSQNNQRMRLIGINAPEIGAESPDEKRRAMIARDVLKNLILGKKIWLMITRHRPDRYGRLLAIAFDMHGHDIGRMMLDLGYARVYHGMLYL